MENKLSLLSLIREQKEILFGQFSATLTNDDKQNAWKQITEKAKSIGVMKESHDWRHLRDKTFSQWKSRTLEKKDNQKVTGKGGEKGSKLTELDKMMLEIIGVDSPVICGLGIAETWSTIGDFEKSTSPIAPTAELGQNEDDENEVTDANKKLGTCRNHIIRKQQEIKNLGNKRKEYDDKAQVQQKRELQIQILKLERRKKLLEIYELEERLGVPHCQETNSLNEVMIYEIEEQSD